MKKLLFFIESLSGGGAEKVLVTLLKHIDYNKYHVSLIVLNDVGVNKETLDLSRIDYRGIIKPSTNKYKMFVNKIIYKLLYNYLPASVVCRLIIPQHEVDIYVSFVEGYCTKILSYLPRNKKKIAWVHIDLKTFSWTIEKKIFKNLSKERKAYLKYDKVVCVSYSVEKVMKVYYRLTNTITIYNPLESTGIRELAVRTVSEKIDSSAFNIVSIGRLVYQKGYDLLIPIIARLVQGGHKVKLYLVGEGSDRGLLNTLIHRYDLNNDVFLMGFLTNPYALLKKMDLFVCSSRSEGFSLVIAEALILQIPVISMNCSGPNELLGNNQYGQLCNDYEELYQYIKEAVSDEAYYFQLKQKAKEGTNNFGMTATMREIDSLFNEL